MKTKFHFWTPFNLSDFAGFCPLEYQKFCGQNYLLQCPHGNKPAAFSTIFMEMNSSSKELNCSLYSLARALYFQSNEIL